MRQTKHEPSIRVCHRLDDDTQLWRLEFSHYIEKVHKTNADASFLTGERGDLTLAN